jgi:hypothetical protein
MTKKTTPDLKVVGKRELTYKQKRFVKNVCDIPDKFSGIKQAYCDAYDVTMNKDGSIPKWVSKDSSILHCTPSITLAIKERLQRKEDVSVASSVRTREYVIERLFEESKSGSDASRVRSLELLGKSVAMFTDKIEETTSRSSSDVMTDIENKLEELLESNPDIESVVSGTND